MRKIAAAVLLGAFALGMAAACSKPQQPKVEIAKPLDTAKALEKDIIRKAEQRSAEADAAVK